ncbi:MAG: hypothetical protein ACJA1F_000877 [Paracoccaceae bacterium]|jgi:hypothetical protein
MHLSQQQFAMLDFMSSRKEASDQLTPGRYRCGTKDGSACFPWGDDGPDPARRTGSILARPCRNTSPRHKVILGVRHLPDGDCPASVQ